MAVEDLITKWEEGLAEALTGPRERKSDLSASDLRVSAGVLVRSKLQAGWNTWDCCQWGTEDPSTYAQFCGPGF